MDLNGILLIVSIYTGVFPPAQVTSVFKRGSLCYQGLHLDENIITAGAVEMLESWHSVKETCVHAHA